MSPAGFAFFNWSFMRVYFLAAFAAGAAPFAAGAPLAAVGALFGISFLRRAWPVALTEGRTTTRPPSDPGTAPLIINRLRATSISTMRKFSMVRFLTPMWPDMRLPLNTRPGVWGWQMEPGAGCEPGFPVF